ncbi:NCS2 family permease [Arundinibacter roseus]|uniref:NCS2 family permease n=1 Tax=Arundinibacter roseus TaxID=2070510 RepID=A0A4R4KB84_9BACT|nr:NCS2 family permease [Arundinibacter roseus]TDB65127.1 NCS2 family permease [Arundinibacter roseus]
MLERYFELSKNKTSIRIEFIAGLSTFLATMYIIVVNPSILSQAGMPFSGVLTATVLLSFLSSLLMGFYAKNPLVVAPGMGLNAFFTFTAVKTMGIAWETALGAVFWSGIIFLLLSLFNVRTLLLKSIPVSLRHAVAAGIGLFIALIGLSNAGFIVANPATLVSLGDPTQPLLILFIVGLALTAFFITRKTPGGIVLSILIVSLLAYFGQAYFGLPVSSAEGWFSAPDFSLLFALDFVGSLQFALWPVIFAFVFTDLFDSLATFVGVAEAANLKDADGNPRNIKKSLLTDAVATTLAGLLGTSPGTTYIESAVGIEQGGRTGLTAVFAGLLFLPFMFLSPLLSLIPAVATAPALVIVGVFMIRPVVQIDWKSMEEAIPAFLALVLIPFSYSITQGIIWGFLSWTFLKLVQGKYREISPVLIIIDILAILSILTGSHAQGLL